MRCSFADLLAGRRRSVSVLFVAVTAWLSPLVVSGAEPVAHWKLDEPSGEAARDSSAGGRDGDVHGATAVDGVLGRARLFDGRDDFITLGDLGEFPAVTIAFWVRPADVAKADDWQGLVTSDAWDTGLLHVPIHDGMIDGYLHLGGDRRGHISSPRLKRDVWYHVAVVADTVGRTLRLYVNGSEQDLADLPSPPPAVKLLRQVIGREFDGSQSGRYFHGAIDDVRIYDCALNAEAIRALCPDAVALPGRDPRNIRTGCVIPDEGYCDQPYVVVTRDGNWLCTLTTAGGAEGANDSHVVATISTDQGRTWSELVDIEPADGPDAVYIMPLVTPGGRVYGFYNYNGDNFRCPGRSDCVGWFVFKYSDDHGRTWSPQRYRLPMRMTDVDRTNTFGGKIQMFWGIGKPITAGDSAILAFTKCGKYLIDRGEGWFYRSDNILTETDPGKIDWQLLPDGEVGLKHPDFGEVQEEHNLVPLSDGSLYCMYRTTNGYPCQAYSRDGAHTWTTPEYATYTPGGRKLKNPRACPRIWRASNGRFLFWYHNHSGQSYAGRNPAWLAGGVERDGRIHWSQPEILLYDPDPHVRMSYPDLIEQDGRYWVTETNKTTARVHEIDKSLLEGLWAQGQRKEVADRGRILDVAADQLKSGEIALPKALDATQGGGLSLDCWIELTELSPGQVLLDSRDESDRGLALTTGEEGVLRIEAFDGQTRAAWDSDPGLLAAGRRHHVVVTLDAGPKIIMFLLDGQLCDGSSARQYGWGRYNAELGDISGTGQLRVAASVRHFRLYDRPLRNSEAVANYHAGLQ